MIEIIIFFPTIVATRSAPTGARNANLTLKLLVFRSINVEETTIAEVEVGAEVITVDVEAAVVDITGRTMMEATGRTMMEVMASNVISAINAKVDEMVVTSNAVTEAETIEAVVTEGDVEVAVVTIIVTQAMVSLNLVVV